MLRRGLSLTFLVLVAVQLLGGVALASVCFEPCPDEGDEAGCPPVCAACTTCPHSRQGIVQTSAVAVPEAGILTTFVPGSVAPSSPIAADIFHVPLLG